MILLVSDLLLMILGVFTLPFCLGPIFTVGIFKYGASKIPLEEFPMTASEYFNRDKYLVCPSEVKKYAFFLFLIYYHFFKNN